MQLLTNNPELIAKLPKANYPIFNAAITYLRQNIKIIPLAPSDKIPCMDVLPNGTSKTGKSWSQLMQEEQTQEMIEQWFVQVPKINIGIVMQPHSNFVVLDFDKLPPDWFPKDIPICKSHRGFHLYFHSDKKIDGRTLNKEAFTKYGDVKSVGYVVAPPSIHPESHKPYVWYQKQSILTHKPEDVDESKAFSYYLPKIAAPQNQKIEARQKSLQMTARKRWKISRLPQFPTRLERDTCSGTTPSTRVVGNNFGELAAAEGVKLVKIFDEAPIRSVTFPCWVRLFKSMRRTVRGINTPFFSPFRDETHPSCRLSDHMGVLMMKDFGIQHGPSWFHLSDVYFFHKTGMVKVLTYAVKTVWTLRCLHELGLIAVPEIKLKQIKEPALYNLQFLYQKIGLLASLREFYKPNQLGVPFTWDFGVPWCDNKLTVSQIQAGLKLLVEFNYLNRTKKDAHLLYSVNTKRRAISTNNRNKLSKRLVKEIYHGG